MVFIKPYPENGNPDFFLAFLQTLIFMVAFILGINILNNFKMYNWHNSKVRKKSATGEDLCLKGVGMFNFFRGVNCRLQNHPGCSTRKVSLSKG